MGLAEAKGSRATGSTSDGSALLRAGASFEPDPAVRCPDDLARAFVGDLPLIRWTASRLGFRGIRLVAERRVPGAWWYEVARVKHFDAKLLEAVREGAQQVVILGAGLDSRAYRFARELSAVAVFEVDHPATASRKVERVEAVLGASPSNVTYVRVDLQHDSLGDALELAGFDPSASTFVLWCGVTMYLDEPAVEAVLSWFAQRPAGSALSFDYAFAEFIAGSDAFHGAARARSVVAERDERFTFGLEPDDLGTSLAARGLTLAENLGPDELSQRYLRRRSGKIAGRPYGFTGAATAVV